MRKTCVFLKVAVILAFALAVTFVPMGPSMAKSKEPVVLKNWVINWPASLEIWRVLGEDLKKLGIRIELKSGTLDEWVGDIVGAHKPYHTVIISWGATTDRLEPSFFLTEFFHSSRAKPGGRNYGHYINEEYDKIVDAQVMEMDLEKRQKLIRKAQEILHRDNVFFPVFHKDYIQAYNIERIEGVVPTMGTCIGFPYTPWTFIEAKPKKEIKEPRIAQIRDCMQTWNPFATTNAQNEGWHRLIYDRFVIRDRDTKLIPWAAESWDIVDSTTVDIVLRDGMKFFDGKPVTVEDVKFTFDYIKKWKFPGLARTWRNVESVDLMGGRRVRFKLVRPYGPFVANVLMHTFVAPKHVWEKIPESVGVANPIDWPNPSPMGSGIFRLAEWKKGEYFHLIANKDHWMAPNFDGLYYVVTPSVEGMMAALEKGQAEILGWFIDGKQGKKLDAFPHLKMVAVPGHGMHELRPNLTMKPMDDPEFRRAFQHAINRRAMLDIVMGGYGTVCRNTPISPLIEFWNNPDIPVIEFDLNKAREILKAAGYTWDEKGRLCYPE